MRGRPLLLVLALTLTIAAAQQRRRQLHRLVGGHQRILDHRPDDADAETLLAEASGARDKKPAAAPEGEERKTLAQQVADGKYGLIQKELFAGPHKRPGVISYEDNPEVPNDNKYTLGGLDKNEIWLAENHLLVLRGGRYPPPDENRHDAPAWPPIDEFRAPLHQVKIPKHPKVPPPFPVQLTEGGPLQILGTNSSRTLNGSAEAARYALPPPIFGESDALLPPLYPYPANASAGPAALPIPGDPSGGFPGGLPGPPLNGTWPPYFESLPPGAAVLPPPLNQTDPYDEDDPSIYYPPPYSFFYPKDNSSVVPAGPLVPGIILPPPPDFFAPLEETTTVLPTTRQRKPVTTTTIYTQVHPTTKQISPTVETTPVKVYPAQKDNYYINEIKTIRNQDNSRNTKHRTEKPEVVTVLPVRQQDRTYLPQRIKPQVPRKKPQMVTILRPVKPNTPPPVYTYENEISDKPFAAYEPPTARKSVTTTQVPLRYYTTGNEIESNSVTQPPEKFHIGLPEARVPKTTIKPAQFFYYDEEPSKNSVTTPQVPAKQNSYYDIPNNYYVQAKPTVPVRQRKPQYIYVTARPYNTQKPRFRFVQQPVKSDTFSIHIAKLQNQIHQYYTSPRPTFRPIQSPKPVYQYSFQATNYQQQRNRFKPSIPNLNDDNQFRPIPKYSVQIQQAIEITPTEQPVYQQNPSPVYLQQSYQSSTERPESYYTTVRPSYQYQEEVTQKPRYVPSRPISQYSFEVTPNPVYQGFYTKPDEGYFDDNTKKYFTMFGQKLPSATSPIPSVEHTTSRPYVGPNQQNDQYSQDSQYQQKPISLEGDTLVNYVNPRPTINPDAELIPVNQPSNPSTEYPKVVRYTARPPQNPEIIKAVPIEVPDEPNGGSFISYQLPGDDGAHFYFLTPQLAQRRDQGAGYFYSQPNDSRIRRDENNSDTER